MGWPITAKRRMTVRCFGKSAKGCLRQHCHAKGKSPLKSGTVSQEEATREVLEGDLVPYALETEKLAGGCRLGGYGRKDDRLQPGRLSGSDGGRLG